MSDLLSESENRDNIKNRYNLSEKTINHFSIKINSTLDLTFEKSIIFNDNVLKGKRESDAVFVVGCELDVATLFEVGADAICFNKKEIANLIKIMCSQKEKPILLLDSTFAEKSDSRIINILTEKNIKFAFVKNKIDYWEYLNENFIGDKDLFIKSVEKNKKDYELYIDKDKQKEFLEDNRSNDFYFDDLVENLNIKERTYIPTGFSQLDITLDGGFYEGLYILGSGSSNGKTTFAMQIGDHIASQNRDVLIFSLEMARSELMLKSLSRLTFLQDNHYGMSVRDFSKRFNDFEHSNIFNSAKKQYKSYSDKIMIKEAMGEVGALQIRQTITDYINYKGERPVVIIDYLQMLAPYSKEYTRDIRLSLDKTLLELKKITRDLKVTIIAISSFNRDSYFKGKTSLNSFKESGAIEYTSDVLMGLHFKKEIDSQETLDREKSKPVREMELVILKNRNGELGKPISYGYNARFNYFKESEEPKILNKINK